MVQKQLRLRMPDGTWQVVGIPTNPINLRMPNGTWKVFGGGPGNILSVRNGTSWTEVSSSGMSRGIITGLYYEFDPTFTIYTPLKNKTVSIYSTRTRLLLATTQTNTNGKFTFTNVSLEQIDVYAYKATGWPRDTINVTLTSEDPIKHIEIGTPETYNIPTYSLMDALAPNRFLWATGWDTEQRQTLEWRNNPSGDIGTENFVSPSSGLSSQTYTTTGWSGGIGAGDFGTDYRYRDEILGWYSVPIGMFLDAANLYYTLDQINNPQGWSANAFLEKIEVVHKLTGFSVQKSQVPWMSHYGWGDTTLGLYPGVGALRYQGHTPTTNLLTGVWNNTVYTVPAVRDHAHVREDGVLLWSGNLNDLGVQNAVHGLPAVPVYTYTQTFVPSEIPDVLTSLQYTIMTSPLPDPVSFAEADSQVSKSFTLNNFINDMIDVKIYFKWH